MFMATCQISSCRKPEVISRQYSPSATPCIVPSVYGSEPNSFRSSDVAPLEYPAPMKTTTLIATST